MKTVKDHVITVRLTASEHQRLKSTCGVDQASMSAIVRKTMLDWVDARSNGRKKTDALLAEVAHKLDYLISLVDRRAIL